MWSWLEQRKVGEVTKMAEGKGRETETKKSLQSPHVIH